MSTTRSPLSRPRRRGFLPLAAAVAVVAGSALVLTAGQTANAGIVPTVPLATSAGFSVLAGSTVTNTGPSVINRSVGLSPGTSITGFPPGVVPAPATIQTHNAVTIQAKNDLTTAYNNAAGRVVEFTQTNPDLVGQTLIPGVYAGTSKAPLSLSGALVLDGQNNPDAVFIFQTDSTLITSSNTSISLINGASACNVFWQVGSSATLGSGSVFVGTILALTSVTVESGVTVQGRAFASVGAVTLDNDVFTGLPCDVAGPATTTTTTTTTTTPGSTTTTPGSATTTPGSATTTPGTATTSPGPVDGFGTTVPFTVTDITLPRTGGTPTDMTLPSTGGRSLAIQSAVGAAVMLAGLAALMLARRRQPA